MLQLIRPTKKLWNTLPAVVAAALLLQPFTAWANPLDVAGSGSVAPESAKLELAPVPEFNAPTTADNTPHGIAKNAGLEKPLQVYRTTLDPDAGGVLIGSNSSLDAHYTYSVSRLSNPHRLVISLPNAEIDQKALSRVLEVQKHGIQSVQVVQEPSITYRNVRVILEVQDAQTLGRLTTAVRPDGLYIDFHPTPFAVPTPEKTAAEVSGATDSLPSLSRPLVPQPAAPVLSLSSDPVKVSDPPPTAQPLAKATTPATAEAGPGKTNRATRTARTRSARNTARASKNLLPAAAIASVAENISTFLALSVEDTLPAAPTTLSTALAPALPAGPAGSGSSAAAAPTPAKPATAAPAGSTLSFLPGPMPLLKQDTAPIDANGRQTVTDAYVENGHLVIKGRPGSQLSIAKQFVLDGPSRLVIDLSDAALADRALLKPIEVANEHIQRVRLGQLDQKTVRVVLETRYPERFLTGYDSPDRQVLKIYPSQVTATRTTLERMTQALDPILGNGNGAPNEITGIEVTQGEAQGAPMAKLNLKTSAPLAHKIFRDSTRVWIELPDVVANEGWVGVNAEKNNMIESVRLDKRANDKPGSVVVVKLNPQFAHAQVQGGMSSDKKNLEIVLTPKNIVLNPPPSHTPEADYIPVAGASGMKAPFPARIVVDAGHGGKDAGAQREGKNEKDLNLAVALKLRKALEARGFKVYMTRSTDEFLPLSRITSITNNIHPDLFISVHHNASTNPSLNGIETYYYTPQSLSLANKVHNRLTQYVKAPNRNVRKAMFYVIHHTPVPAILCELGYVSNSGELAELAGARRQNQSADAIADGVIDYLKTRSTASAW